jgi:hypothetical protein
MRCGLLFVHWVDWKNAEHHVSVGSVLQRPAYVPGLSEPLIAMEQDASGSMCQGRVRMAVRNRPTTMQQEGVRRGKG